MCWRLLAFVIVVGLCASTAFAQNDQWLPNDTRRPLPSVVTPAAQPGGAPSDAVILFDGKNLAAWEGEGGQPAPWRVEDGDMVVVPGAGDIRTRQGFGDCQLHIEWMEPSPAKGTDQSRGNSGVMLMSLYEIQVLDMWQNKTYADGEVGAIYGQYPPLVGAWRKAGEWQTYDIVFRRPRFDPDGHLISPAHITVFQNGIVVQDDTQPTGPTAFHDRPPYMPGPDKLPLTLQDHGSPVRYRNIWIRELPALAPSLHYTAAVPITVDPQEMAAYAGHYRLSPTVTVDFEVSGKVLLARRSFTGAGRGARGRGGPARGPRVPPPPVQLAPINHDAFLAEWTGNSMRAMFTRDAKQQVTGVIIQEGATWHYAPKVQ